MAWKVRQVGVWAVCLLIASPAMAQIAPPPPPAPEPTEFTPPPPPTPRPRPEVGVNTRENRVNRPNAQSRPQLPDVEYESLVERGEDGFVSELDEPVQYAALKRNPLVTEDDWTKINPLIDQWNLNTERFAAENIDLLEQIEGGLIDRLNLNDTNSIKVVTDVMRPFQDRDGLIKWLTASGGLTAVQSAVSDKIANEYTEARTNEAPARLKKQAEDKGQEVDDLATFASIAQTVYYDLARDAFLAYDQLLIDAAPKAGFIASQCGVDAGNFSGVRIETDDVRLATMKEAFENLDTDQKRAYLLKAIELKVAAQ